MKEIVEEYNGQIDVESTVGVGSPFTVKIPITSRNDSQQLEGANCFLFLITFLETFQNFN